MEELVTVLAETPSTLALEGPSHRGPSADAMGRATSAWMRGVSAYARSTVRRRLAPWEVASELLDWTAEVLNPGRPQWTTPHRIVLETPIARLRDFTRPEDKNAKVVPTLLLPPQAGHDSCIVDYSPKQSQLGAVLDAGLVRAWSLDWKGATRETRNAGIEDYLDVIEQSIRLLGGRVNLIGDCQGGWLATIYAALHPDQVHTLTIAGAPIDFHCGDPVIRTWMRRLASDGDLHVYRDIVALHGGVMPGHLMLAGFKMMALAGEVARQMQLLLDLNNPPARARYREFAAWFEWTQDVPGAFYLWIVEHLFARNGLLSGELEIGDQKVDVGRIHCPLYLLAGETDHITPPAQVWALAGAAGTPPEDIVTRTSSGGHLGLFMGTESLREHWPVLLADVRRRSDLTQS
jgi:poly(3-hydroxybutyrate) depolymerase